MDTDIENTRIRSTKLGFARSTHFNGTIRRDGGSLVCYTSNGAAALGWYDGAELFRQDRLDDTIRDLYDFAENADILTLTNTFVYRISSWDRSIIWEDPQSDDVEGVVGSVSGNDLSWSNGDTIKQYQADGTINWSLSPGVGISHRLGHGLGVDASDNVYYVTRTFPAFVVTHNVQSRDAAGNIRWTYTIGAAEIYDVSANADIVAIAHDRIGGVSVTVLDTNGNFVWSYDTGADTASVKVHQTTGDVYVCGSPSGGKIAWGLNVLGNLLWSSLPVALPTGYEIGTYIDYDELDDIYISYSTSVVTYMSVLQIDSGPPITPILIDAGRLGSSFGARFAVWRGGVLPTPTPTPIPT